MTVTTWNPSDKSANILLSNGNLKAANNGAVASWSMARANTFLTGGKWYFEFQCGATDAGFGLMIGIANATASLSNFAGSDNNGTSFQTGGSAYQNSAQWIAGTGVEGFLAGHWAGCAMDLTGNLLWFWSPETSKWNNSGTANPATGVGGHSIAAISQPVAPAVSIQIAAGGTDADYGTLNAGLTSFSRSIPSGFSAIDVAASSSTGLWFHH